VFHLLTSIQGVNEMQQTDATLLCAPVQTSIGRLYVAGNGTIVTAVARSAAAAEASVWTRLGRPVQHAETLPEPLAQAIAARLRDAVARTLDFDLEGLSEIERATLRAVLEIPRGEVRTYGQIARQIGQPRAAKEVGAALAQNPIPVLIPCHRVVYADGRIGGYVFGSRAKRTLLHAEGVPLAEEGTQLRLDLRVA
jgi:O-6-methylguanine DNA methyltransferase